MYYKKLIMLTIICLLLSFGMTADAQDEFIIKGVLIIQGKYGLIDLPKEIAGVNFDCSRLVKTPGSKTDLKSIVKSFKDINKKELPATYSLLNSFKISDDKLIDLFVKYHVSALDKIIPDAIKYDTLRVDKWGNTFTTVDYSQWFVLYFPESEDIDEFYTELKKIKKLASITYDSIVKSF